jgi:hypothetical protein
MLVLVHMPVSAGQVGGMMSQSGQANNSFLTGYLKWQARAVPGLWGTICAALALSVPCSDVSGLVHGLAATPGQQLRPQGMLLLPLNR